MNDFTKEELQDLYDDIWRYDYRSRKPPEYILALRDKIQSMIDTYCDHTPQIPYETAKSSVHMCIKCLEEYVL